MRNSLFIATLLILTSCGFDCVDKKTGMHKSSQTLKEAQTKGLYKFQFLIDKATLKLDSGLTFTIKNAWVENDWRYECIDNKAQVIKDSSYQLVIDADYKGNVITSNYWLGNNHLGAVLAYSYSDHDTIRISLVKDKTIVDTITFVKQVSH